MRHMEEIFGRGKDNLIALATLAQEPGEDIRPAVRTLDAMYEDGAFYAVTYRNTNKMRQIARSPQVAVAGCTEMFTASAVGEDWGWVLDPATRSCGKGCAPRSPRGMTWRTTSRTRTAAYWPSAWIKEY